jgi:hypothetical protein
VYSFPTGKAVAEPSANLRVRVALEIGIGLMIWLVWFVWHLTH